MAKAMKQGLIARKRGMTQVFAQDGNIVPVTVLEAGPCTIVQVKTQATDGYDALQLGFEARRKKVRKPMAGHFKKAGVGAVRTVSSNVFGQFVQQRTCPDCGGAGEVLEQPCEVCRGEGRVVASSTLDVDVPRGIHDGQQIRVRGEGHAGLRSKERGNAFVVVRVRPDPRFVRDGDDLHTVATLSMTDAALGMTLSAPGIPEDVEVEVPAGTQPGSVRVLEGRGMPALRGSRRGDLYVTLDVAVPTRLTDEQRAALAGFAAELGPDAYEPVEPESLLRRLRNAFR